MFSRNGRCYGKIIYYKILICDKKLGFCFNKRLIWKELWIGCLDIKLIVLWLDV